MLSRRQLRVKILQALYSFYQSGSSDLDKAEKELLGSIEKIYELYLHILLLVGEIAGYAEKHSSSPRHLPGKEDAEMARVAGNLFIRQILSDARFVKEMKERHISWGGQEDLIKKLAIELKNSESYKKYINAGTQADYVSDRDFMLEFFKKHIVKSEPLRHYIEEKNIHWNGASDWALSFVYKSIETAYEGGKNNILPLFRDEEDKIFVRDLFRKTILHGDEYEKLISSKAVNWDLDRIALMDIVIMKMSVSEILNFPGIPVKVSINEYLDISKEYSTPKSSAFINGIIDRITADFRSEGKIVKSGRGLVE